MSWVPSSTHIYISQKTQIMNKQWDQSCNQDTTLKIPRVGGLTAAFYHSVKEDRIPATLKLFYSMKCEIALPSSLCEASTIYCSVLWSLTFLKLILDKKNYRKKFLKKHGYKISNKMFICWIQQYIKGTMSHEKWASSQM